MFPFFQQTNKPAKIKQHHVGVHHRDHLLAANLRFHGDTSCASLTCLFSVCPVDEDSSNNGSNINESNTAFKGKIWISLGAEGRGLTPAKMVCDVVSCVFVGKKIEK